MPIVKIGEQNPLIDGRQSENALIIQRGMVRFLEKLGHAVLAEFPLASGRRADLLSIDRKGLFTLIEIKSSIEDFRVDTKWPEYAQYCDRFAFATSSNVPADIFPAEEGLYVADAFGAEVLRDANECKLAPASRKALTLRFARIAAKRAERTITYALANGYAIPDSAEED
ncbi:MAG: MmcB family DNA repair protein [Salaquimonas sp.]